MPKGRQLLSIFISLLSLTFLSFIYINKIYNAILTNSINNLKELTTHDIKSTEAILERTWGELQGVGVRIKMHKSESIQNLQHCLITERISSSFYSIYLLDVDGNIYTDTLAILPPSKQHIYTFFKNYPNRPFTVRYVDTEGISEQRKSVLLYGIHIPQFSVEGVNFVGVIGLKKISDIQSQMCITSFNSRGYSSIINLYGDYIVQKNPVVGLNNEDNFYKHLEEDLTIISGQTLEDIKETILLRRSILMTYKNENGQKKVAYLTPMPNLSWYFISVVSSEVFSEQSRFFITISVTMLLVMVAVIFFLIVLLTFSRKSTVESRALAQARSEFLSNMSHEIRTPLNGIIGLNHLMTTHIDNKTLLTSYLKKASNISNYLLSFINDILDFSKLQAGKVTLITERTNIDSLITDISDMQCDNIKAKNIAFTIVRDTPYLYIDIDSLRIKQVLMNLLSNAVKFTHKGGQITLSIVEEVVKDNNASVTFTVKDTGEGISKDFIGHIFESFSQDNKNRSNTLSGTGLGLTISSMIIKLMHGSITVESAEGLGSTFKVTVFTKVYKTPLTSTLPKKDKENLQLNYATSKEEPSNHPSKLASTVNNSIEKIKDSFTKTPPTSRKKVKGGEVKDALPSITPPKKRTLNILIAEDNELNANILIDILEDAGFKSAHATDGFEAISMFSNSLVNTYDVILMDVQMPRMDGYEAAKTIRALNREDAKTIPIFACSANTFSEDILKARESGMNDFLSKPIDINKMLSKLNAI